MGRLWRPYSPDNKSLKNPIDGARSIENGLVLVSLLARELLKSQLYPSHGFIFIVDWSKILSTKDEHHSGRPIEVTTPEMIDKIHHMVLSDLRIKVREIVEATGILQGTVFSILHEKLGVRKIPAR